MLKTCDCGAEFKSWKKNMTRCQDCQKKYTRSLQNANQRKYQKIFYNRQDKDVVNLYAVASYADISAELGISRERCRQLENRALIKLQARAEWVAEMCGVVR